MLYVGNLERGVNARDLDSHFGRIGRVKDIEIFKGYAYIEYYDRRDADTAAREI
jgi:RNA recognition motif-containing protein